jgi:type 1 glutamine amidotransferase
MQKLVLGLLASVAIASLNPQAADKRIILIAGGASHGSGDHEHSAGCLLFQKCLNTIPGVKAEVFTGWPQDANAFDGAAAIVIYSDGGGGHPGIQGNRLQQLGDAIKKGTGFGCVHYAVEVPKDKGGKEWLEWIGGYFETDWSVNPFWTADFKEIPKHPVARGVKPFKQVDEWYYHMRFQPGMKGVTPILSALPPADTLKRTDGPHENVMWVYDRPDGGRGFGFTGGHSHKFWGNEDYRKAVLNAILWLAKIEVPENGLQVPVSPEDLKGNLDAKGK